MIRVRLLALTVLAILVALGCGKSKPTHYDPIDFPSGFLWGSANASYQVEGGNFNDDWWAWEQLPGKIANGDHAGNATDFYDLYDTDFALAQADGHNAFRLSIEWSRIEPQIGVFDTAEIAHYRSVLVAARARGLRPLVTLEHWTLPLWADDPRNPPDPQVGWLSTSVQAEFVAYSTRMASEYGDIVDDWMTLNEPMVTAAAALQGQFPPLLESDLTRTTQYAVGMIKAHAAAYDAIKATDVFDADSDGLAARVGIAQHIVAFHPKNPADQLASDRLDHVFNRLFLDAIVSGTLDTNLDGSSIVFHPELAGRLDYVGLNYYRKYLVLTALPPPLLGLPLDDPSTPHNDLGWSIYPRGMYESIMEVGSYGLPVLITENGIADEADTKRASYIVDHLVYLKRAMDEGVPVTGYIHWSLTDNFEWAEGFTPKFGLYAMDYATQARTARPSAKVFSEIVKANSISSELQAKYRTVPKGAP